MRLKGGMVVAAALATLAVAGCGGSGASSPNAGPPAATTSPAAVTSGAAALVSGGQPPPKVSSSIAASVPASPAALANGRMLFQASHDPAGCGFCHTFRPAATSSPIGPNLDAELTEVDLRTYSSAQLAQRVRNWIQDGACLSPTDPGRCMPPGVYDGAQADAIAVFVATCGRSPSAAGCKPTPGGLTGQALAGEHLFQDRGCVGCHFSSGLAPPVGPNLNGLAGSKVQLANGKTVVADDGYLVASIAAPDSQIVKGYQGGLMSARVAPQDLTDAQIQALVAYLKALH